MDYNDFSLNEQRNCTDEAIVKMIGKITLKFPYFNDLEKQRELKQVLEEALYGYNICSQSKELLVSDMEEKINIYLSTRKLEGICDSTLNNYLNILHKFKSCFQTKTIAMITTMDIRYFLIMYKQNRKVKDSTLNGIIWCLKAFFNWLYDNEFIEKNPMKQIKEVKLQKDKPKVMTTEQEELLRENCKDIRERAILELVLSSGLRVSEVANLKLSNINFDKREITLVGKGRKERTTFFSVKAKMLLEKYLSERKEFKDIENVFLANKFPYKPIKVRSFQLILNKIKHRANLDNVEFITFHNLRKKCFTDGLSRGLTIAQVQSMAGHSSPSTTIQSYIHISNETLRSDYNKAML